MRKEIERILKKMKMKKLNVRIRVWKWKTWIEGLGTKDIRNLKRRRKEKGKTSKQIPLSLLFPATCSFPSPFKTHTK